MNISLSYREESEYLLVNVAGAWELQDAMHAIEAIRDEANTRNRERLFLDIRLVSKPDKEMTRYFTGEHIAKVWGPYFRIAVLANPELYNRFAENVAVNRGTRLAVFLAEEEAITWLLETRNAVPMKRQILEIKVQDRD